MTFDVMASPSLARRESRPGFPLQRRQQRSEERAVLRTELHPVPTELPLKDSDLMTQNEDLRVLLSVAHRQQPDSSEGTGDRRVGKAKQHK
ncbi:hypothetical protein ABH940_003416 [Streptacidiphilus sp. BW17]|uniref:hypothetical protein n=1 Tax=Streptacidiphilus sp. BW17 TaxID=3156274 RepID=UPI0035191807